VRSEADVRKLKTFDPETDTGFLMEAIRRLVREVGRPFLCWGLPPHRGLWPATWWRKNQRRLRHGQDFMYAEPRTFRELLGRISQATISYLQAQIRAGAAAVQLFDTWCGELNLRDYLDFALPAIQEIVSGLEKRVPVIYYTKASSHLLLAAAIQVPNVLSVDWRVDFAGVAARRWGRKSRCKGSRSGILFAPRRRIRRVTARPCEQQMRRSFGVVD